MSKATATATATATDDIINALKQLDTPQLFKILKAALAEVEKSHKNQKSQKRTENTTDTPSKKKTGSQPKGAVPPQLRKPRAWVEYTLKNAQENGWDSFTIAQKKKDKETGTTTEELIEMPASVLHNGTYIYKDSITEKTPEGRPIIHKEAMSLSKHLKQTNHPSYTEFEASYTEQ